MLTNAFSSFTMTFQKHVQKFQQAQQYYMEKVETKIGRELQIMEPELDKGEIKELIQDPGQIQTLLERKVYGTAHFSVVKAVEDIKEKYDDILTLEAVNFDQNIDFLRDLRHLQTNLASICLQKSTFLTNGVEYHTDNQNHR